MSWNELSQWVLQRQAIIIRIFCLVVIGFPLIRVTGVFVRKMMVRRFTEQSAMLTSKLLIYGGNIIIVVMIMRELNFKLTAILGAAGVAGVAIGFASQTSLSNFISGMFLIWEKPFQVNDVLDINGTIGTVHSIDLLSVKLRTLDNKLLRIPNEALIKGTFTNITHFPIRRFDLNISVAYKEDIKRVTEVLLDVANQNPHVLDEPEPVVIFKNFGDSGLEFMVGVWFEKTNLSKLRSTLVGEIKNRFDAEGIEIPFPHMSLYAGSQTAPFPIKVVNEETKVT